MPELPLTVILAVQAVLSLRLVLSNTAFADEALYISAGQMEWQHWLHGMPIPAFQTYFSGAPVIYPPLAALANSIGGLVGARILSLFFMLGATALLYGTTARLFGRNQAIYAAAIFAVLAPVQVLGVFATYDAMAIFLIALATWFTVRARGGAIGEVFLIAAGLSLALGDATKYAAALWTPIVILLAALTAARGGFWRSAYRALRLAAYTGIPLAGALFLLGGKLYIRGVLFTTLARQKGSTPASVILDDSFKWIGIVILLAAIGTLISFTVPGRTRWICLTLTVAGLLAPLHQIEIHTFVSLHKHVAFGAWFAAIAAGYALARAAEVNRARGWRIAAAAAGMAIFLAVPQATTMFYGWPNSSQMTAVLGRLLPSAGCPCLITDQNAVNYYIPKTLSDQVTGPYGFWYWSPTENRELHGIPAYTQAIRDHYFSVIEIDPGENTAIVGPLEEALAQIHGYYLVDILPIPHWGVKTIQIWRR